MALLAGLLCPAGSARGVGEYKEYFVAPNGRPDADGSRARPLNLATALSATSPARPGDTIWLLGGTYRGAFVSRLEGTQRDPIVVRRYAGERATIDCRAPGDRDAPFTVEGQWTTFWGLEVTCSNPRRLTKIAGSHPEDIRRGGISCLGSHIRFINMAVHDCGGGFGFWSGGEGGEIYGCIIYNNGWQGPDRGHGHAIYAQNKKGTKQLVDNVMFNQFGYGIHAYGSARAFLEGFHIEGNVSFNNGSLARQGRAPNILVGGDCPALGYGAANEDAALEDNYFVGGVTVRGWGKLSATGNTFIASAGLIGLVPGGPLSPESCRWDENTYYAAGAEGANWRDFFLVQSGKGSSLDFAAWQGQTGLDRSSKHFTGRPKDVHVFIRPNQYELGRAHVIVYNWPAQDAIEVDLKDFLKIGSAYELVNVQDYFGRPAVAGTYDAKPVRIPLRAVRPAAPVGLPRGGPAPAGPVFSVFVLRGA
ncbi:MAG: hypothetical protein AMJ81_02405 [Phycisphaerae bacterium SM23_33]|nr:MAG: hypothetical protein AMJ81_02405 [Phycisphaerae bacterium SM23_33]